MHVRQAAHGSRMMGKLGSLLKKDDSAAMAKMPCRCLRAGVSVAFQSVLAGCMAVGRSVQR